MFNFLSKTNNKAKNLIEDVVLAVTYRCNSRCQFCNIWQNKEENSISPTTYKKLPHNLKNVNISGGEPFMRDDLVDIIKVISRQCPKAKIIISTNGFLPSKIKQTMTRVAKFRKNIGVAISLDGFGKVHERLRGFPGGFCLAVETIKLLKELGIKDIKIAFTMGDKNFNQLKRIYRLSRELGVEFTLAVYHNSSHYFQKESNIITNIRKMTNELKWLMEQELSTYSPKRWLRAYFTWGMIKFIQTGKRVLPDYSGLSSIFIDPLGKIYPSDIWSLGIGNLDSVRNWNDFSERTRDIIQNAKNPSSWMICTARQSMKKHAVKVIRWILKEKFCLYTKGKKFKNRIKKNIRKKKYSFFYPFF